MVSRPSTRYNIQGENAIEVHDLADQIIHKLELEYASCLEFSPDGLSLAAGDMHVDIQSDGSSLAIAYSSDEKLLAQATSTGEVSLWQIATESCLLKLKTERQIEQLSFGPDNRSLMTEHGRLIPDTWPSDDETENDGIQNNDDRDKPSQVLFTTHGYGIDFDGCWLTKDSERIVWLPPEHRPSPALVIDSEIAIRNSSDQLMMFCFYD
ncbi:hypothetical protein CEK27_009293 [Fusarium fujikuroi]|nr:hypothetical protein CEK27_009293 [Fusarium fujikuroi]